MARCREEWGGRASIRGRVHDRSVRPAPLWRLARSVRRDGRLVQETVAQLGELDAEGRAKARTLARTITGRAERRELLEEPAREESVPVRLERVRLERGVVRRRVVGVDAVAGAEAGRGVRGGAPGRARGGAVVGDGGGAGDRTAVQALERAAHRRGLVPAHRTRGPAGASGRCGERPGSPADFKQVCIALVVTREGIPLGYEVEPAAGGRTRLADRARWGRGQGVPGPGRDRDLPAVPLAGATREGARHACALRGAHRGGTRCAGAPQRGRLRAAYQRHRLDARVAVADLRAAHRGRSGVPHPKASSGCGRSGTRRPSGSRPTSWCASSPTCCGRPSSSGRSGPDWAAARSVIVGTLQGYRAQHGLEPLLACRPGYRDRCLSTRARHMAPV